MNLVSCMCNIWWDEQLQVSEDVVPKPTNQLLANRYIIQDCSEYKVDVKCNQYIPRAVSHLLPVFLHFVSGASGSLCAAVQHVQAYVVVVHLARRQERVAPRRADRTWVEPCRERLVELEEGRRWRGTNRDISVCRTI